MIWLLRMKRWVQRPPSVKRVKLVFGTVAFCVLLFAIERVFGWPDWLTGRNIGGRMPRLN